MVRRGDDDGVDVLAVQQAAEVGDGFGPIAHPRARRPHPRRRELGDRHDVDVGLGGEIDQMARADEASPDHAHTHPVAGRHTCCTRTHRPGHHRLEERPSIGHVRPPPLSEGVRVTHDDPADKRRRGLCVAH